MNDDGNELTMKLRLAGENAVNSEHKVLLYAQIEDPENPGNYESFTCSIDVAYFDARNSFEDV